MEKLKRRRSPMAASTKKKISESVSAGLAKRHDTRRFFKSGYRADIDLYVRSRFEANYIRYLKYKGVDYAYEPKSFELKDGSHYTPDLYIKHLNIYIELKGKLTDKELNKYTRFREEYPHIKWQIIRQKSKTWQRIKKEYQFEIPYFELDKNEENQLNK